MNKNPSRQFVHNQSAQLFQHLHLSLHLFVCLLIQGFESVGSECKEEKIAYFLAQGVAIKILFHLQQLQLAIYS